MKRIYSSGSRLQAEHGVVRQCKHGHDRLCWRTPMQRTPMPQRGRHVASVGAELPTNQVARSSDAARPATRRVRNALLTPAPFHLVIGQGHVGQQGGFLGTWSYRGSAASSQNLRQIPQKANQVKR